MKIFANILRFLDVQMETPTSYGWFHLVFFALSIAAGVLLCVIQKKKDEQFIRRVVFITSVIVILLEIYKQINYSFSYENGIEFYYQWYAFPFQFCSMPMYVGFLTVFFKKGRIHDALFAFLATFSLFAGLCVMFYPGQVFIGTVGINIQTMICHGSMVTLGIYLLGTEYVRLEHKTILKAICVFAVCIVCATVMNEIAFFSGILEEHTFNMFFISPHCEPSLPVYSIVQQYVPYPFCLVIYLAVFSLASYLVLLAAMGIKKAAAATESNKKQHAVEDKQDCLAAK